MEAYIDVNTHLTTTIQLKSQVALNSKVDFNLQSLWLKCKNKLQGIFRSYMQVLEVKHIKIYKEKMKGRRGSKS